MAVEAMSIGNSDLDSSIACGQHGHTEDEVGKAGMTTRYKILLLLLLPMAMVIVSMLTVMTITTMMMVMLKMKMLVLLLLLNYYC